ncbi:hypothetical protein GCM10012275_33400 [Longimycelium tulufanense]|uniref:Uncharacterized protein n=1 Tax=Longimycelium tulufanense TaxID=907463 RepID=A0A8J3CFN4_9PSEU|nr:hypothetical protein [Longimycelium tulufanense]GGM59602.1 hypothetical protein GCM10012275_33400 [Longimycelium tulufanense]
MSIGTIARRAAIFVGATALALGGTLALAAPASAETNPYCSSVTKIGSTAYVTHNGQKIASVKQFKGCGKNWAYVYVWESYRKTHKSWETCASIAVGKTLQDLRCISNKAENWSAGANTLNKCTVALGSVPSQSGQKYGKTSERC